MVETIIINDICEVPHWHEFNNKNYQTFLLDLMRMRNKKYKEKTQK